jgi:hypothetical protein
MSSGQGAPGARKGLEQGRELRPGGRRRRRRHERLQRAGRVGGLGHPRDQLAGGGRADARHQLQRPPGGTLAARVGGEAQHREHVLDMRGLEEFQAAVLDEGDVAPGQLELERAL